MIIVLLMAVICGAMAASCAVGGGGGRVVHTIFAGTGTLAPVPTETETITDDESVDISGTTETSGEVTGSSGGDITTTTTGEVPPVTGEDTTPPPVVDYNYEVVTSTQDLGSGGALKSTKTLRYPRISGLDATAVQNKINTLLANIAEAKFSVYVTNVAELIADGAGVDYEITKSEITYLGNNILSARSEGTVKYSGNTNEKDFEFIYCNFVNLSTGKELKSKDIYSDFGSILDMLGSGAFTKINDASDEGIEAFIKEYKANMVYNIYPDAYFTADALVIVVDETLAEYSISFDKVNGFMAVSPTK